MPHVAKLRREAQAFGWSAPLPESAWLSGGTAGALALLLASCAALWFINGNFWALAALPVVAAAAHVDVRVPPRLRWAFYAYYPLHPVALWLIRIPMSKAGYIFF